MAKILTSKPPRAPAARAPITKRVVDAAKPGKAEYVLWDDGGKETVKGFGLKVTPAGSKVYLFQYRLARPGKAAQTTPRKYTIGRHGALTPDQARDRARELASLVSRGIDPRQSELDALAASDKAIRVADERARIDGELTLGKLSARWIESYALDHRPSSVVQGRVSLGYMLPTLRDKPLPSITRADLQAVLDTIPAHRKASRQQVYAYMSILWRWALERGDITQNPVATMAKPKASKPRDRVLTDRELVEVWQASERLRPALGAFYRLLLLTGQRREEVAGMSWGEVDRDTATWTIPAHRAKNGSVHIVPLVPAVVEEFDRLAKDRHAKMKMADPDTTAWPKVGPVLSLRAGVYLSSFGFAKLLLDDEITKARGEADPIAPWRVHDLRRTLATGLQRLGVRFEVTEAVLNHVSGARSGVAGIYQRHDWKEEKRTALDAWANHVASILAPADATNVVPIGAATKLTG